MFFLFFIDVHFNIFFNVHLLYMFHCIEFFINYIIYKTSESINKSNFFFCFVSLIPVLESGTYGAGGFALL